MSALGFALLRPATDPSLRRWVVGIVAGSVLGAGFHAALLLPEYVGDHPTGSPDLVVVTLNLRLGGADAGAVVALARRQHAQLVVLEEVTPGALLGLDSAGIGRTLPYRAGNAGQGGSGTVVFSAYPLSEVARVPLHHDGYRIAVAAPAPFWLVAVHLAQPLTGSSSWRSDWSVLNQVVPELRKPPLQRPVLLVGDFNSTLDHRPVRDLLGDGFADAARAANSGWQPTWPKGGLGLIAIDHVLTSDGYRATSTSTSTVGGSDHRALVARLVRS